LVIARDRPTSAHDFPSRVAHPRPGSVFGHDLVVNLGDEVSVMSFSMPNTPSTLAARNSASFRWFCHGAVPVRVTQRGI
jgi:hypothetical protein